MQTVIPIPMPIPIPMSNANSNSNAKMLNNLEEDYEANKFFIKDQQTRVQLDQKESKRNYPTLIGSLVDRTKKLNIGKKASLNKLARNSSEEHQRLNNIESRLKRISTTLKNTRRNWMQNFEYFERNGNK